LSDNNIKFVHSLDTTYYNQTMKAEYDNHAIGMFKNDIFEE